MSDLFDHLVEEYFEADAELLPDGALEKIKAGGTINILSVPSANQLDIKSIVDLLTAVVGLIAAIAPLFPKKGQNEAFEQVKAIIEDRYSEISAALPGDELDRFIEDVVRTSRA